MVEVAESTLFSDTTAKAERYATPGAPDYCALDVYGRRWLVYRYSEPLPKELDATADRTHRAFGTAETIAPLATPAVSVRAADLLP